MAFKPIFPPTLKAPGFQATQIPQSQSLRFFILNNISVTSWLLLGGSLLLTLALVIPPVYILLPSILILLSRFGYVLLISYHILPNPYLKDSILHRVSPQVPNDVGEFSDQGASEGVVCFHLGAKYNHPLGAFSPNAKELNDHMEGMLHELQANLGHQGFLGGTFFFSPDAKGAMELTFISYWRSIEAIHNFAYGPLHRKAWDWWSGLAQKDNMHLGINHEIFGAGPGQWEAIYINHQPTLMGATTFLKKGDKFIGGTVDDTYVNGLMDAKSGKLNGSAGRLGRQPEQLYEKHGTRPASAAYKE